MMRMAKTESDRKCRPFATRRNNPSAATVTASALIAPWYRLIGRKRTMTMTEMQKTTAAEPSPEMNEQFFSHWSASSKAIENSFVPPNSWMWAGRARPKKFLKIPLTSSRGPDT